MAYRMLAGLFALASILASVATAQALTGPETAPTAEGLCGTLFDFTRNSGCDGRIWSDALCKRRDLYVYVPPGYDPRASYPLLVWMHGYMHDEREFARDVVPVINRAVVGGQLPPIVVAGPDGSLTGNSNWVPLGSWYVNSPRGRFADYMMQDVVRFVEENFAISRDPARRAIAGFSMGGFGAYSLGLKNPDRFNLVAGISPALNMRYVGASGRYFSDFDPGSWSLRQDYSGREIVGRFYLGLLRVRAWQVVRPVWGRGPTACERVSADNPIELLERVGVKGGDQKFYVGYGLKDELNVDAQVESFLHVAAVRGIPVETRRYPSGDHSISFMLSALPDLFSWIKAQLPHPDGN